MTTFQRVSNALNRLMPGLMHLATLPLAVLSPRFRSEALERLTQEMNTSVSIPGGTIRFHTPSPLLLWRAASLLGKEPDTIRWIDTFEQGAVFWDVGANVGVYSLYAAVRRSARVLSFEPSAANYWILSRNIQLNSLAHQVVAYCLALARRTELGILKLRSPAGGAAFSCFCPSREGSTPAGSAELELTQGMIGFSIDEFIAQFAPPFPNYIKIDVDGLEPPILLGAERTLKDPRLRSLMVEVNSPATPELDDALALLERSGFGCVSRGDVQRTSDNETSVNHLFQRLQ